MAATPYSFVTYEGLSAATDLAVPFPYISRGNVRLFYVPPGGDLTSGTEIPQTEFSWVTDGQIRLNNPIDGTVRIERHTYEDNQLVRWQDGSYTIAADLNLSDIQWLYLLQEHHDFMLDRRGGTMLGQLLLARDPRLPMEAVTKGWADRTFLPLAGGTMTGPLVLAGDPVDDLDAVPKQYVQTLISGPSGVLATMRNPLRLFVSKAPFASDSNNGTSLAEPLLTFDEAIRRAKPGTIIQVEPGTYEIANLPFRVPRDVTIRGDSVRNVRLKPAPGSETKGFFKVDSGFYCWGLTFTGHQAVEADPVNGTPAEQAWVVRFDELADNRAIGADDLGAYILKSPYIQNCTSYTAEDDEGTAGSLSVGSTGGGVLVDGEACASNSPIKSMVVDSYTQVNLGGPGCLVINDAYAQLVSFFGTFCTYHVKAEAGGQVNLSGGSTSDFGEYALVADGYSPKPIYTGRARAGAYGARLLDFKAAMDTTANTFTKAGGHGLVQNDLVTVNGAGMPPELRPGVAYWVLVTGPATFQLAATKGGAPIDVTGSNAPELEFTRQGAAEIDVIGLGQFRTHYGSRAAAAAVPTAGQLFFPRLTFPSGGPASFQYERMSARDLIYLATTAPNGPDHVYVSGGTATINGTAYGIKDCTYDKTTGQVRLTVEQDLPPGQFGSVTMEGLRFICTQSAYVIQGSSPIDANGNPVAENSPNKAGYRIQFYNDTNGGLIYPIEAGQTIDFRLRSQITAPNHTFEYVGSGMNYSALPFAGGRPNPGNHVLELNNGRVFFSGTDELGNFYVGRQFNVDGTTGTVTINTDEFNLSGLNFIGPFSRNGGISTVGVQLREVSDNGNMLNSLGVPGADTVPTQRAVKQQLDLRPFFVDNNPPVDPRVGTVWVDTRGFVTPYVWSGSRWAKFSSIDTTVPVVGKAVALFTIDATAGTPVTFTAKPSGAAVAQCQILWGDGQSTDGAFGGTHTYVETGRYTIEFILRPDTAVLDGNGWPTVSGGQLRKVGPLSVNTKLKNYGWGTADTLEIDMSGLIPAQPSNAGGLFRDRFGLKPAAVKGVDWSKVNSFESFIENRQDLFWDDIKGINYSAAANVMRFAKGATIDRIGNITFALAPSAAGFFENATVTTVENVEFTVCTAIPEIFKGAKIGTLKNIRFPALVTPPTPNKTISQGAVFGYVESISLPLATTLLSFFAQCSIGTIGDGLFITGPQLTTLDLLFDRTTIGNQAFPDAPLVSNSTGVLTAGEWLKEGYLQMRYVRNINLGSQNTKPWYGFNSQGFPESIWNVKIGGLVAINQDGRSAGEASLKEFGMLYQGACSYWTLGPRLTFANCERIIAGMFDAVTRFDGSESVLAKHFKGAKLNLKSVDDFFTSLDKAVAAGAVFSSKTVDLSGGTNAAPSANTLSGPIARLRTAGWTIATN